MKINFKNGIILTTILTLGIGILNTLPASAKTLDINEKYNQEISEAIISGDGSAENPYVLNEDKSPLFTQYLEKIGHEAINPMTTNSDISTYGVMDGVLSGTSHSNQTSGGYWLYGSGKPSTDSNGNIWMKQIEYLSATKTTEIFAGMKITSNYDKFIGTLSVLLKESVYTNAVNLLVSKGLSKTLASALCTWLGFGGSAVGFVMTAKEIADHVKSKPFEDAISAKKGIITCYYNTSYQGAWYSHSLTEVWGNYPTAKEPGSYYGKGTYKSR